MKYYLYLNGELIADLKAKSMAEAETEALGIFSIEVEG